MQEFELSRNIAIGQYIPTGSVVHRLDPRTKILCGFFLLIAVSVVRSVIVMSAILGLLVLITWLARLPFAYILRGLVRSLPLIVFFMAIALLYLGWQEPAGRVYFEWSYLRITRGALQAMTLSLIRLVCFVFLVSLPSLTSTVSEITHGVEILLLPFRRIGVPAHEIALVNMIALRFVPTLADELERVIKAQASRLGEIGELSIRRPVQIGRALLPLVVPLFVNAFRRAEELAVAMEARGYVGGAGRTKFVTLRATWQDPVVVGLMLTLCLLFMLVPWPPLHILIPGL
jgi:energy-coupling factor transport system permease protein